MAQDTAAAAAEPESTTVAAAAPAASMEAPAADATGAGADLAPTDEQFFEAEDFADDGAEAAAAALEELGLEGVEAAEALLGPEQRDAGKAQAAKEEGNRLYQEGDNEGALRAYTRAILLCPFQYDKKRELARARRRALQMEEAATGAGAPAAAAPGEGAAAGQGAGAEAEAGQQQEKEEEAEEPEPFAELKGDAAVYYCNRAACLVNLVRPRAISWMHVCMYVCI